MKVVKAIIMFLINLLLFVIPVLFIQKEFTFLDKKIVFEINKNFLIILGIIISLFSAISSLEFQKKVFTILTRIFIILYFLVLLNFGSLNIKIENPAQGFNYLEANVLIKNFTYFIIFILIIVLFLSVL